MKQYLIDQIQHLAEKKQELQNDLKQFVQDKSLPLSDRWEIFCLAGNEDILPTSNWIEEFEDSNENYIDNDVYFGKWWCNKNEVIDADLFISRCEGNDYNIDSLKEEWIDKFIWSFELDW